MSIINTSDYIAPLAVFETITDIEATPAYALSASFETTSEFEGVLSGGYSVVVFSTTSEFSAFAAQPVLSASFETTSEIEAQLINKIYDVFGMDIIVDILPADLDPELWLPRVKIDGVEYPIIAGNYARSRDQVGGTLQVELARIADKSAAVMGSLVEFGIGKKVAGVWDESTFEKIMIDGEITGSGFSIGGTPHNPTDSFTIRAISKETSGLGLCPTRDLVMYDSAVQTLNPDDFRVKLDSEGREYTTELKPVANLKLYQVFQEIYVNRCGYASYKTNIPDIPVTQIPFTLGRSYNSAIAGFLGVFNPLFEVIDGQLWIISTDIELPAGFPAPRTITASRYNSLSVNTNASKIDGVWLSYVENKRGYDYIETTNDVKVITSGNFGDPDYTSTLVQKGYRIYKKLNNPTLELRRELYRETQETSANVGTISEFREDYLYDELCRLYNRSKLTKAWLPDVNNAGDYDLLDSAEEEEIKTYSSHPFQAGQQYVSRTEMRESGLIMVDSSNPQLGQNFEMPYDEADSKGNLSEGQTTRFGPIKTLIQSMQPQRNGTVRTDILELYHVRNKRVQHPSNEQPADIAMNAIAPEQNGMYVFADENAVPSTARIEDLHAGPLPVDLAVPWARRWINRRRLGNKEVEVSVERYDRSLTVGTVVQVNERDYGSGAASLGFYITTGLNIPFGNGFVLTNLVCEEVSTTSNYSLGPSNPGSGFNYAVASNSSILFTVPIDCIAGYELSASAVSTLAVEARKQGDVSWVNIETTPIDLTADAGMRVNYEIRLTGAVVTSTTRRNVKIRVKKS